MEDFEICNLALGLIGQQRISSLGEGGNAAPWCKQFYEPSRDEVLTAVGWRFALRRKALSLSEETDDLGRWEYAYNYPYEDCKRLLKVMDANEMQVENRVIGRAIYTNINPAYAEWTRKITNEAFFTDWFILLLYHNLAYKLAMPITKKIQLQDTMFKKYTQLIPYAQSLEGSQDYKKKDHDAGSDPWIRARGVGVRQIPDPQILR